MDSPSSRRHITSLSWCCSSTATPRLPTGSTASNRKKGAEEPYYDAHTRWTLTTWKSIDRRWFAIRNTRTLGSFPLPTTMGLPSPLYSCFEGVLCFLTIKLIWCRAIVCYMFKFIPLVKHTRCFYFPHIVINVATGRC